MTEPAIESKQEKPRLRCRDVLRATIYIAAACLIGWFEMALTLGLIAIVIGLLWLAVFVATATSFLWLPVFLATLPFISSLALLLRYTRLGSWCAEFFRSLRSEPYKSKIWTQWILRFSQW